MSPFILVSPATRGLSLAVIRHYLRTTSIPVVGTYRPHSPTSGKARTPDAVREHILSSLGDVDPARLRVIPLDFTSEASIAAAAAALADALPKDTESYICVAFFLAGILLMIKHFSRFLPPTSGVRSRSASPDGPTSEEASALAKWVHVSARVGSISDNALGGWYSYRASKAALNQVVRTFDLHLQAKKVPAICVGVHPGTVKTDFSKAFWSGVKPGKLFEPAYAAERLVEVVKGLGKGQRGRIWDWKGDEVKP